MKNKSIGINALLNGLRSLLNIIFPLITFPYVSRVLSVDGMGIYNFSNTYVNYFLLIANLGIATYAVREGAKWRDNRRKFSQFASQVLTINIISTIGSYCLLLLSLVIFKSLNNYISAILIFSLQLMFTTIGTEWIYVVYEEYKYITLRSVAFEIISIIFLFLFVKRPNDYLIYAGITVFASVGGNVLNIINLRKLCDLKLVKKTNWHNHLKPILIIFASDLAVTLYVSSDTTILGLIKNDYAVGIYSIAVKIYFIAQSLLSSILVVTIPRLAMLLGQNKRKEYDRLLAKLINVLSTMVFPVAVCLMMLSKEAVLILAGKKYLPSVNALRIITWAIIFSILNWIVHQCVLIPAKREKYLSENTFIAGIGNVILNFFLIPLISYDGTALSTVLAEATAMLLDSYRAWDMIKEIILSKTFIRDLLSTIFGCLSIVLTCLIIRLFEQDLVFRTILSVALSILIYVIVLLLLKNRAMIYLINKIKFKQEKRI